MSLHEDPPFIGDWHRQKKLGSGGFGVVTLWKNQKTQQCVAIKRCHTNITNDAAFQITIERWDREVDYMTHRVKHENIVSGLTIKPDSFLAEMNRINPSPMPVLVMEYCEGGDLRQQLNANANTSGLSERETRDILRCLGTAIAYLHTLKITHRDIKPENIVIKKNASSGRTVYKLTDLGYAKPLDQNSIVASLVGTLEYIAPELCLTGRYRNSVDYWSLGVIAYEMVTGTRPFVPHLPFAQWMIIVKNKTSDDICITEDPSGNMVYGKHLPNEHQISTSFAARLEPWLKLALEWCPKQRGHVTKNSTTTQANGETTTFPPIPELRIFTMLDSILSKRFLTMFCLHSYERRSYEINDVTSMATLKVLVAKDTGIAVERMRFVVHSAHPLPLDKVDDRAEAKAMQMFWPDQDHPRPMCYVYSVGDGMRKLDAVGVSPVVSNVMANRLAVQKAHTIKRFGYDTFYVVRREQRKYFDLVEGLHSLALRLNHELVLHDSEVQSMIRMAYHLEGVLAAVDAFPALPSSVPADPSSAGDDKAKIASSIAAVIEACENISKRYKSLVRRSNETNANRLVDRAANDKSDPFAVAQLEKDFEILRVQLVKKVSTEKQHQEMMRCVKACGQRRDQLLREKELVQLLGVTGLALEMEKIQKTIEMSVQEVQKYKRDVLLMSNNYHNRLMSAIVERQPQHCEYLPDIDGIGISSALNEHSLTSGGGVSNGVALVNQQPFTSMRRGNSEETIVADDDEAADQLLSMISVVEEEAADALILKNEELRLKFESLIQSLNAELDQP